MDDQMTPKATTPDYSRAPLGNALIIAPLLDGIHAEAASAVAPITKTHHETVKFATASV